MTPPSNYHVSSHGSWRALGDAPADIRAANPFEYWRKPDEKGLTPAYWDDPKPEWQGMLTSEHIRFYDEAVGGMIRPFEERRLRPASYEMTLGARCVVEGKDVLLDEGNPWLEIPQNSIAFVSFQQVLCLPHYVVGRFDLAIKFIYQGLLLGTGPQVDPGFQGALGCPLHNISNNPILIRLGEDVAKVDFVKTIQRREDVREALAGLHDENELRRWADVSAPDFTKFFKGGDIPWREPIYGYLPAGKRPGSSVRELYDRVGRLQRNQILGIIGVLLAAAALVFTVVQLATARLATEAQLQRVEDCQAQLVQRLGSAETTATAPTPAPLPAACR